MEPRASSTAVHRRDESFKHSGDISRKVHCLALILMITLLVPWATMRLEGQSNFQYGNITQLAAGTGGTADNFDGQRNLLPLVYQQSIGTGSFLQSSVPTGALSRFPASISKIGFVGAGYQSVGGLSGANYNVGPSFQRTARMLLPLGVDPENMDPTTRTWFSWRGVDGMMPLLDTALTVNSNFANTQGGSQDQTIVEATTLQIPFLYGLKEGSSWHARLVYEPEYEWVLQGTDKNTLDHFVNFSFGRDYGKSALGVKQVFTATSNPIAELTGRNKRHFYKSSVDYVYEVTPKFLLMPGLAYDRQKQFGDTKADDIQTETYGLQIDLNNAITPKLNTGIQVRSDRTLASNQTIPSHVARARVQYFYSEKLGVDLSTGIQLRQPPLESSQISHIYDMTIVYNPRIKTTMEFGIEREIRPSLAREGLFIHETDIDFSLEQAILLRWVLDLGVEYSIRRETDDSPQNISGDQNSFTYSGELRYLLSDNSIISGFFSRNQIKFTKQSAMTQQNLYGIRYQYQF